MQTVAVPACVLKPAPEVCPAQIVVHTINSAQLNTPQPCCAITASVHHDHLPGGQHSKSGMAAYLPMEEASQTQLKNLAHLLVVTQGKDHQEVVCPP